MAMLRELRERVLEAGMRLRTYDLIVMAGGTVAARDPETNLCVITPSGMEYETLRWDDMCVIDIETLELVDGYRRPSCACDMFTKVLRARPDILCVTHSHSRYATAFAVCDREIPVVTTTHGNLVGGPVPCTHWVHPDPHEERYLQDIVDTMGDGYAVNIRNHGLVVGGPTVEEAIENIITCEVSAQTAFIAEQLGNPYYLTMDEADRAHRFAKSIVGQHIK
ncbi:MAG: class II aldolase/adducin family protein [Christensenella sp.]|uniref:class II aldolase/adducin family protein n=1 Tax=Christensenella sp. TaxID=1935934 RepID=UPI002B217FCE|nr:class II aldolase/adducin family protein [Christensenella sp.]MEA5003148.1 class II aldolase/adducin family protein [Christensenella sp.]